MTITSYIGFSECVGVLTSDTRQVAEAFGHNFILPDKDDKITKLAPNLITVSSGYQYLSDYVFKEIQAVKPKYLEDVYGVLKGITPNLKKLFEKNLRGSTEDFMSFSVMGINAKGKSNVITYNFFDGEAVLRFENKPYGAPDSFCTLPSDDNVNEVYSNIGELKLTNRNDFRIVSMDTTKYLLSLQKEFFRLDPEEVSDTFCYYVIYKDVNSNEYIHKTGKVNVFEGNIEF